jgi:hypothetical protein
MMKSKPLLALYTVLISVVVVWTVAVVQPHFVAGSVADLACEVILIPGKLFASMFSDRGTASPEFLWRSRISTVVMLATVLYFVMRKTALHAASRAHRSLADRQPDYILAHKHCMENRGEVEASVLCGCFYCMSIYPPSEIVDWIDDQEALTADCPRCGLDAVIGSASGFPITSEFLNLMNEHWFEGHRSGRSSL